MALDPWRALLGTRLCQPGIEQSSPHGFWVHAFAPLEEGASAWLAPLLVLAWIVFCAVARRRAPHWRALLWRAQLGIAVGSALALAFVVVTTRHLPDPSRYVASLPVTRQILPQSGARAPEQLVRTTLDVGAFQIEASCKGSVCFAGTESATVGYGCGVGPVLQSPLVLRQSRDGRFAFFDGLSTRYAIDPQPAQVAFRISDLACVDLRDVHLPRETRPDRAMLAASILLVLLAGIVLRARAAAMASVLSALSSGLVFYFVLPWLTI